MARRARPTRCAPGQLQTVRVLAMRGDDRVLEFLNEQLTAELTAINQYFLHSKMQENFGWVKLARHTRAESIDEMRHAETLADRILFLDGLPNFQRLFPLRIGQTIGQMFGADLAGGAGAGGGRGG